MNILVLIFVAKIFLKLRQYLKDLIIWHDYKSSGSVRYDDLVMIRDTCIVT